MQSKARMNIWIVVNISYESSDFSRVWHEFMTHTIYSFGKGDVDVSALRDQIKQLEAKTVEQHEIIHEMRVRGNIDPRKDKLYSYRFNPTHSKKKKSEIEISISLSYGNYPPGL